jgi:superfamily II DNA/RNA helicase
LAKYYDIATMDFSLKSFMKHSPVLMEQAILPTAADQKKRICSLVELMSHKTPVIIVFDKSPSTLKNLLIQDDINVTMFNDAEPEQIVGTLKTFTTKTNGRYPTVIISLDQSRGMDFPSSEQIEANGGNHLILASMPSSYAAYQQALGRTCRIGNKGIVSIILWEAKAIEGAGAAQI